MLVAFLTVFVAILLVQAIAQWMCVRIDAGKFPPPGILVKTSGEQIHVCNLGAGAPPIVLEAGIAASSLGWSALQGQLAALTLTYSYDRRGFGWSSSANRVCTLQRLTDDLHELVNCLSIPKPYVLTGHSYAAYILRVYACRYPDELAGIILVDPLTPEEWINPARDQRWRLRRAVWFSRAGAVLGSLGVIRFCLWLLQRGNNAVPRRVVGAFGGEAKETVERILSELAKLPPETVRLIRERWSHAKFFWTMARYIRTLPACAAEASSCDIPAHIPVTVISGAHQSSVRLAEHEAIAAHSLHGRHVIATRSAHWIHLDEPELIVQAYRAMVAELKVENVHSPL